LFAFWGAEEIGLLGSRYFVHTLLDPTSFYTHDNTILNLNFDMLGSPNYIRYVYNATTIPNEEARGRSGNIQTVFEDYFKSKSIVYAMSAMSGGSDYFSFNEAGTHTHTQHSHTHTLPSILYPHAHTHLQIHTGIPAGALATGAGALKSEASRVTFGGMANTPYPVRVCACVRRECACARRECACARRECACARRECACARVSTVSVSEEWWVGVCFAQ
jgi:hypothetical protein